jgi:hypothetical protein
MLVLVLTIVMKTAYYFQLPLYTCRPPHMLCPHLLRLFSIYIAFALSHTHTLAHPLHYFISHLIAPDTFSLHTRTLLHSDILACVDG